MSTRPEKKKQLDRFKEAARELGEAVEERINSKLSDISADISVMRQTSIRRWEVWASAGSAVAAILGISLTVIAIAGDRFSDGLSASGLTVQSRENAEHIQLLIEQGKERDVKLDLIIKVLEGQNAQSQASRGVLPAGE